MEGLQKIPTLSDIVFEGRNQAYGAYQLRKHYDNHVNKALLFVLLGLLFSIGAPAVYNLIFGSQTIDKVPVYKVPDMLSPDVLIPKLKISKPVEAAAPAPSAPTKKNLPLVISKDGNEKPPTKEEMKGFESGNKDNPGEDGGSTAPFAEPGGTGTGEIEQPSPPTDDYVLVSEVSPQAPYNFMKFLKENLKYPVPAAKAEVEGVVHISFIVDEQGNITRIEAVGKRAGFGLDEEALRVISKMPPWQPGLQAGRPVKVRMIVPVFFKMVK